MSRSSSKKTCLAAYKEALLRAESAERHTKEQYSPKSPTGCRSRGPARTSDGLKSDEDTPEVFARTRVSWLRFLFERISLLDDNAHVFAGVCSRRSLDGFVSATVWDGTLGDILPTTTN